jgi:serine protease
MVLMWGSMTWAAEPAPKVMHGFLEPPASEQPAFVPGEVVVKMKPSRTLDAGARAMLGVEEESRRTSGGEIIYRLPQRRGPMLERKSETDRTLEAVKNLRARDDVLYAQPNWIKRIVAQPNDPLYSKQWHYHANGTATGESPGGISLPKAWDTNQGKAESVVAVVDTGILPDHPDIAGSPNLLPGYDMITEPAISNDSDGRDTDPTDPGDAIRANECYLGSPARDNSWHGTHVAGTIGVGRTNNGMGVAGVNWNVQVMAVRVLGKCGGTTTDINDGIRWAAGLEVPGVPANPHPARVINMSLGTPPGVPCSDDPATQSAIRDAVAAGALVVIAAGNDAVDAASVTPASCDEGFTVAASDYRGHLVTRYSNFGADVKILAPGGDLRRDDNNDGQPDGVLSMVKDGYAYFNGTSMAAPHVAGVAALIFAEDSSMIPGQVMARLMNDATPRTSAQCPKPCGAGLLTAFKGGPPPQPQLPSTKLPIIPPPPPATSGSLTQPNQKVSYSFDVAQAAQYTVETHGTTDVFMSLFGPNSATTLLDEDDDDGESSNAKITQQLAPGTYHVQVRHYSPTGTGEFTITVQQER